MTANDSFRNLFDLSHKVVLVTGACGIQGKRVCRGLAAFGASVAIADLAEADPAGLAEAITSEYGVPTLGVVCDVANKAQVEAMTEAVVSKLGAIDVLHNNAATKSRNPGDFFVPFEEFSADVWREVMATNLDGMFLVAQAVGRHMVRQGKGGSIIQVASTYGVVGPDFGIYEGSEYMGHRITTPAAYSASKAGVAGLTRYLATYWGAKGVRVNTLVPGGIESGQNETFRRNYAARTPLGRMAKADEMVGAVVYLASDASTYMTGQMLVVDGGWTAW